MMTYWLVPVQEDDWEIIKREKLFGYKKPLSEYIHQGDRLIVYVSKYYARRYGGKIVGVIHVVSDWFESDKPIFMEEIVRNKEVMKYRVKVEEVITGVCDIKEVLPSLRFVEDKYQLAKYLRNTPANLQRPIPEDDAEKIINCLKNSSL